PAGGTCPTSTTIDAFGQPNCNGAKMSALVMTACQAMSPSAAQATPTNAGGATCTGAVTPVPTPQVAFQSYTVGCVGGASGPCAGGGVCAKQANHLCVYASGTPSCPGAFPQKAVIYGELQSTYSCSLCVCGVMNQPTCVPTTSFYQDMT